ncbi:alkaline phosphatase family protein [Rhodopila sp.]|uniref:alkaline phosphatase family protein n=1 Tax=Rhodopila sp. TaxID=2480087 RepID=UPI003D0C4974
MPIEHIVVLMMENCGFDRMLGWMGATDRGVDGIDPLHPRSNPDRIDGGLVLQAETTTRNVERDPLHYLPNSLAQLDGGTNQGFVNDYVMNHPNSTPEQRREIMAYYPRGFLPALHCLAENFVVFDHWFASLPGPTWMNRLFAHTGTSLGSVAEPGSLFSSDLHLYNERTLYDELTDADVSWRIYFGDVPQSLVLTHQYHHLGNYRAFKHWNADIAAGTLPAYTFIEPTYFGPYQNDQHPPHDVMRGDALIAQVYNALRGNQALFEKTLLIVLYDEHGGFFDHVPPPATIAPDDHTEHFGFDRLGFRVPAIFVSPWLDPGVVKAVHDHTSLLRMAAEKWPGVTPLGRRAKQANDPLAELHWRQSPRADLPEAPVAPDIQPARTLPGLAGFKTSLFGLSHHLESAIDHAGNRSALMARAHEALADSMSQARLATDRAGAFIEERTRASGVIGAVSRLLHLK